MDDAFVPLERYVQQALEHVPETADSVDSSSSGDRDVHEVRRFYAALADALDAAKADLFADIAATVLARELALAPPDLERIAARALERVSSEAPLHVLAHPDDCASLRALEVPVRASERLRRGDVTIVLHHGSIECSLGARLDAVLRARIS